MLVEEQASFGKGKVLALKTSAVIAIILLLLVPSTRSQADIMISQSTFDFGKVAQHQILTHSFWVKSTGRDSLRINSIWTGCICTEVPLVDSVIAPGDSIPLTIILDTKRFMGLLHKSPTLYTNARSDKVKMDILLEVLPDTADFGALDVRPKRLDVSQFGKTTRRVAKFHIENRTDQELQLAVTDSLLKSFEVKLPDKVGPGETVEGKIRVFEDRVDTEFKESLTFEAVGIEEATYSVPIKRVLYDAAYDR